MPMGEESKMASRFSFSFLSASSACLSSVMSRPTNKTPAGNPFSVSSCDCTSMMISLPAASTICHSKDKTPLNPCRLFSIISCCRGRSWGGVKSVRLRPIGSMSPVMVLTALLIYFISNSRSVIKIKSRVVSEMRRYFSQFLRHSCSTWVVKCLIFASASSLAMTEGSSDRFSLRR